MKSKKHLVNSHMAKCSTTDISGNDLVLKENINNALSKIENLAYVTALSDNCMGEFAFDFIIDLSGSQYYAITAIYDNSEFLPSDKIEKILSDINTTKPSDDLFSFFIVTNSKIRSKDKEKLQRKGIKIEYNEGDFTFEDICTSIQSHHEKCLAESNN